ncbi:outer membrane beta-barrel family protein [Pontimicrobium aquaticum]|uniref:TonB-dependent receptor n=1 Tax=Pontimicrobium aquaticum TaxID=2565367 RepID=A0A4U0EPC8_9FLAO|nr:outer membrane beta-barrel family protein [Pontimicrobium aquaticum]TJY32944.1 TonB-dependent receptor [Pontimicrobium aquaticum]
MKKLFTLCLAIFFIAQNTHAANNNSIELIDGSITGKVLDATLNEPLPYVNIIIKNDKGETVTGAITLDDGTFKITKIPEGKITVTAQYIGYKSVVRELTISRKNRKFDLGDIRLEEEAAGLDEVTVVAEVSTIQQKVDRKVITIGKDLAATGTASDIMVGVPSVSIDAQTGNISLRGNQNVRVMVDGKLSNIPTAQLLKQIPSTAIKSIELITNPSAKYDPEGMSGIINIVLHKNTMVGFNGSTNVGLSYEKEAKFNSALNLNYRNGKFNFYGNGSTNISKNANYGYIDRIDQNTLQEVDILDDRKSYVYKVGVDFYLNDKNTLSVFTNQNIYNGGTNGQTDIFYNDATFQNQVIANDGDNTSQQYNFDYKLDFDKDGQNIELEVDYNKYNGDSRTDNMFSGTANNRSNFYELNDTERNRATINLDYVDPLSENSKLELGLQARLFDNIINYESDGRSQNKAGDYIPSLTYFDYSRDIYSAYINYSKKINKWNFQVGLRAENVQVETLAKETDLDTDTTTNIPFNNDYFEVYPSAFITFNASEKNSFQLSYSRRVDRPGVGQVNPLPEFNTPLISKFGNQDLRPQFTNSFETNYTRNLEKGSITAGVFYRRINNEISTVVKVDRADYNRLILTDDNFDNTSAYGFELSTNYRPTKWWSINGSFDLYSQTQKSISERLTASPEVATENDIVLETVEVDNVAYNFRVFNNFRASKSLSFTAFGFYRGTNKSIQFDVNAMYFVNLGMRYTFLNNKATFSFSYNDIFNTMNFSADAYRPFRQEVEFNWESNTWNIGLNYRFGGGKYRAKSRKQRDNDEKSGGGIF